jgi:F0F1-type ATP synthase membrane subunit c/vacuolar-type H+-ATPase subunit K
MSLQCMKNSPDSLTTPKAIAESNRSAASLTRKAIIAFVVIEAIVLLIGVVGSLHR